MERYMLDLVRQQHEAISAEIAQHRLGAKMRLQRPHTPSALVRWRTRLGRALVAAGQLLLGGLA
jgi:hypothetical protein